MIIGLLHPGEMGASCGAQLTKAGYEVIWAGEGRSPATARRADAAGLHDVGSVADLARRADAIISICPPAAAVAVAQAVAGFTGIYLDANAVSPATTRTVAATLQSADVVDGGIIGPPPDRPGTTRLYLSGPSADAVADWWPGSHVEAILVGDTLGLASAVKAAYAAWTKGSAALLLAARAVAADQGVEEALVGEWARSQPTLPATYARAMGNAEAKGWRWVGEMEEIGDTFAAAGQPDGFLRAAAAVYRGYPRPDGQVDGA
jgi:3-hydroxyisobutyrate dehydrogenase-like beta-hydroxyacid dehydrogenase